MPLTRETLLGEAIGNTRRAGLLKHFGIHTVDDALTYFPFRVTPPVPRGTLRQAKEKQPIAVLVRIVSGRDIPFHGRRGSRLVFQVSDVGLDQEGGGSTAELVFFTAKRNYARWMLGRLEEGKLVVISGAPGYYNGVLQFTHPEILRIPDDVPTVQEAFARVTRPRPVYHASARLSSEKIHETILLLLARLRQADPADGNGKAAGTRIVPDVLPEAFRKKHGLLGRFEAFEAIHNPKTVDDFTKGVKTFRYEEAYISQLALLQAQAGTRLKNAFPCPEPDFARGTSSLVSRLLASLPFDLTPGQKKVCRQIAADMAKPHPMQRLLQGEVGSGKTIVALLAMLQAVDAGHQAVLVAPTQVLAEQHYENIRSRLAAVAGDGGKPVPRVILLTGALRLSEHRKALACVASGEPCLIIATHAAFSASFQAPNLALAIIDEQHRFGVDQRESLLEKSDRTPHLLVMTATPIPRTAAMTWFGDLQLSELKGLPSGRKPVSTFIIDENSPRMADVFGHLAWRIKKFHECAYVVCPAIETPPDTDQMGPGGTIGAAKNQYRDSADARQQHIDENLDLFAATTDDEPEEPTTLHSVQEIAGILPTLPQLRGIPIATLTGRDDAATKERVMADFQSGKTPILVATTVIEVGVDVPKASSIVIFDADHFGLSQLHQLRGRVGRGGTPGWAFLISRAPAGSIAAERLQVVASTHNGEKIAEADLDLRGAGDVLGDTQAGGHSSFKLLRVVKDARLIGIARKDAKETLAADPKLSKSSQLAGAVLDFRRGNEDYLTKN